MTAVLMARVHAYGGNAAVRELLELAGSRRSPEFLADTGNWISYDEAVALWQAGARVTHHPQFARAVGEDAARRLSGSPVAALLRSLGSPEAVFRQIVTATGKFGTASVLETIRAGPGFAEIIARPSEGFPRSAEHCAWTCGLMSQPTILFGLPPARVEHEQCAAFGAPECIYRVTWETAEEILTKEGSEPLTSLHLQLEAMHERLHNIFAIAAELIAADDIEGVLARITDRAAVEVRALRYLLAVRMQPDADLHLHHKGFDESEVEACAERILGEHAAALPPSWVVVPVRSSRRDYGRLLAMFDAGHQYFPQERELLEVYGRYAASALDSATALMEAKERYAQSSALLELARALAVAGTTDEVARRLADAVPLVVDCDRVGVYLWDPIRGELVRRATSHRTGIHEIKETEEWSRAPSPDGPLSRLLSDPRPDPIFIDDQNGDPLLRELFSQFGAVATIAVPLAGAESLLGLLTVSAMDGPGRLDPDADLLDRLSGVAAQATTALQNGHLVDHITHQALHDDLTGLANRMKFVADLRTAINRARQRSDLVTLFYIDLDGFKPVNDEFGHEVGDELLVAVGERLTGCTRAEDTVARLGGDEFAVLIGAHSTPEDARAIGRRLSASFEEPYGIRGRAIELRASIGRSVFPTNADSTDGLLRCADESMFAAKRRHRADGTRGVTGAVHASATGNAR